MSKLFVLLLVLLVSFFCAAANASSVVPWKGIGDRLLHTFFSKKAIPLSESQLVHDKNFKQLNGRCVEGLGRAYIHDRVIVYYSKAGQVSGFGVQLHGKLKKPIVGLWREVDENLYQLDIATRDPAFACSGEYDNNGGVIGDRLLVAPLGLKISIPPKESEAIQNKWTAGRFTLEF